MPDNLWVKCPETGQMIYYKDLEANQFVVPGSNYHMRMSAPARLRALFDGGEFETIALPEVPLDPLKFRDERRYTDRLKDARGKTGLADAVLVGNGKLDGESDRRRRAGFRLHGRFARHGGRRGGHRRLRGWR